MGVRGIGQWLGRDLLLGPAVRAVCGPMSVGVIGSVAVRHAAPVDFVASAFYAFLRRYGVDAGHEANRITVDFGVERFLKPLAPGEPERSAARRRPGQSLIVRVVVKQSADIPARAWRSGARVRPVASA